MYVSMEPRNRKRCYFAPDASCRRTSEIWRMTSSRDEEVTAQLRDWVAQQIGAIAKPRTVFVVAELPKTRSGKIMRRLLRDIAEGREVGDTTTLTDTSVIRVISDGLK